MNFKNLLMALAAVVALTGCGSSRTAQKGSLPYKELNHYFVNNSVVTPVPTRIDNEGEFKMYFGMAAVMGPNGQPTPIDFNKEYVISVVLPVTNVETSITPVSLKRGADDKVVFTYKVVRGEEQSYTTRPCLAIAVPDSIKGPVVIKEE